jgi:SAM-dependent methyltransferase
MARQSLKAYAADLAYIHDAGFGGLASAAAAELLGSLRLRGAKSGQIVDLGSGSGILARALSQAKYDVLGYDISADMIELARRRAPLAEFRCASCLDAKLPSCVAVTAIGEVFNYLFDARHASKRIWKVFDRVFAALEPGGLFMFDVAGLGRAGPQGRQRSYSEGDSWACLFSAEEDRRRRMLVRDIVTFRKEGELYRRDHEVHRLLLYPPAEIRAALRASGFGVKTLRGYGDVRFSRGWTGFLAYKEPKR